MDSLCHRIVIGVCFASFAAAAEPGAEAAAPPSPLPQLLSSISYLLDEDEHGDTLLLSCARAAYSMPTSTRRQLLDPLIRGMLEQGFDPLHENKTGCNAVFYLAGIPELSRELAEARLLPRELALRIPHEEGALLRYMKLRNNQTLMAKAPGSKDYLTRRYCTPAYARAELLVRNYLGASSLNRIPEGALSTSLTFMHLADAVKATSFINSLTLWEHGEHFLEEIPAHLLTTLRSMNWQVHPDLLRKALHKLGSMLPVSKDDMIECAASAPMAHILEMLTQQLGQDALPELQYYAAAFDPEIVHTALALQMQLKGLPRPWEPGFAQFSAPELKEIRETLQVDAAIRYGHMDKLSAAQLANAATILRKYGMPRHADLMEGITDAGAITLRPELRPAFRTRYEEIKEISPHVALLRYLLEHEELMQNKPEEESTP